MLIYTKEELMSSTDIVRNFSSVLDSIKKQKKAKIAVLRKNRLEAVILPVEEYERIQELADIMEHLQLFKLIKGNFSITQGSLSWIPAFAGMTLLATR